MFVSSRLLAAYAAGAGTLLDQRAALDGASLPVLIAAKLRIEDNKHLALHIKASAILRLDCRINHLKRTAPHVTVFHTTMDMTQWSGANTDELYTRDYHNADRWLRSLGVWAS